MQSFVSKSIEIWVLVNQLPSSVVSALINESAILWAVSIIKSFQWAEMFAT